MSNPNSDQLRLGAIHDVEQAREHCIDEIHRMRREHPEAIIGFSQLLRMQPEQLYQTLERMGPERGASVLAMIIDMAFLGFSESFLAAEDKYGREEPDGTE